MLLIIQIVLGLAFIGLLILAILDAIKGTLIILAGLVLIAAGYTLKLISFLLKKINPPKLVAP
jgi:hypothetical protein